MVAKAEWPKLVIRIDPLLHRKLRVLVALRGTSLDALVAGMLSEWVERESRQAAKELSDLLSGASSEPDPWQTHDEHAGTFHVEHPAQEPVTSRPDSSEQPARSRRRKAGMPA